MFHLSDNHHLRNHFLKHDQVPTVKLMKRKMGSFLADIYLKSMSPKMKNIAKLEPRMKGVKGSWYMSPEDLLLGRSVLKSVKQEFLVEVSSKGIENVGKMLLQKIRASMKKELDTRMMESYIHWDKVRVESSHQQRNESIASEKQNNSTQLQRMLDEFVTLYRTSLNKIENLFIEAATNDIINFRNKFFNKMKEIYAKLLKEQAKELYEHYEKQLDTEKSRLKAIFEEKIKTGAEETASRIHDINVEKHVAVEKIRKFLECQKLACQIYVALNEQERFKEESSFKREKLIKSLNYDIAMKDHKVTKFKELQKWNTAWKKKVAHLLNTFKIFLAYCLRTIPDHANFLINLEKLMLLHVGNIYENPTAESIFVEEDKSLHTSTSKPNDFYLVCDEDNVPISDQDLCPKHYKSKASEFPIIIINKRCIYAACGNFAQSSDKIKSYVDGNIINEADFEDDHDYNSYVPVKYTPSRQLLDFNLEGSLQQLLKQEIWARNVDVKCKGCGIAHCSYCSCNASVSSFVELNKKHRKQSVPLLPLNTESSTSQALMVTSNESLSEDFSTNQNELEQGIEVSHENYDYLSFKDVHKCSKRDNFFERLPPYMKKLCDTRVLSNYEMCSFVELKAIINEARKNDTVPIQKSCVTKLDASTQYIDVELELLSTCFSKH